MYNYFYSKKIIYYLGFDLISKNNQKIFLTDDESSLSNIFFQFYNSLYKK